MENRKNLKDIQVPKDVSIENEVEEVNKTLRNSTI